MTDLVKQLIATCAAGAPSATLDEQIRVRVRPRVVDWNVARQYRDGSAPTGIPQRATPSEEPLRAAANAALRLRKEIDASGDDGWLALVLVAQYIVFARVGSGSPLYNHVEDAALSTREAEVYNDLCDALRDELSTLGGV